MVDSRRDTRKSQSFYAAAVVVSLWTLPWAAYSVVKSDPWLAPGLFGPSGETVTFIWYGLDWLLAPLFLLAMGLIMQGDGRSRRWLAAWLLALAVGFAYGVVAAGLGHILVFAENDPARGSGRVLLAGGGFLLLALVMAVLLVGSPGEVLGAARAGARAGQAVATRTPLRRAVSLGALAVVVASLIAAALAGTAALVVAFSRPASPVPPLTLGHGWAETLPDEGSVVAPVAFSPDGRDLAMADDLAGVTLKSVPGGRTVLQLHLNDVASALAFSPDGTLLATGEEGPGDEVYVEVWDTATGQRVLRFWEPWANLSVDAVAFSPDGSVLAVGDDMGFASLWDARTGRRLAELRDRRVSEVGSLAFSPNGQTLASTGYDGVVDIWDIATGKITATTRLPGLASNAEQRSAGVTVMFSPGGRTLTIGDGGSGVYRWDPATGRRARVMTWAGCPGDAWDVAFSPGARLAATLGTDPHSSRVCVWNVGTGALVATITDPAGYSAASVALRPDGKELAFGDDDGGPDADPTYPASAYVWKLG